MEKRARKLDLKKIQTINLSKIKDIVKDSKKILYLEKKRNSAHLLWLIDFKIRHKFDLRNRRLFKKYLNLSRKLRTLEIKNTALRLYAWMLVVLF